jgi:CHASE3 domain sensor protein
MATPRRGLQEIRTLTGRVKKATLAHEVYLRISHMEMEKARKNVESEKARQLMQDIAARLEEIEAEKDELLRSLGERGGQPGLRPGAPRNRGGFKIKY